MTTELGFVLALLAAAVVMFAPMAVVEVWLMSNALLSSAAAASVLAVTPCSTVLPS